MARRFHLFTLFETAGARTLIVGSSAWRWAGHYKTMAGPPDCKLTRQCEGPAIARIRDPYRYLVDQWPAATAEINVERAYGVIKPFHHFRLLVGCDSSKPS